MITLMINGKKHKIKAEDTMPLLWVIRDLAGYTGTKFGCGMGLCGACSIHLDGKITRSCVTPVSAAKNKAITTIEGLAPKHGLHPVQQAWLDEQVPQCGWCQPGQMMTAAAFLATTSRPTEEQVVEAMSHNYCRCGCYSRIKRAILKAAEQEV